MEGASSQSSELRVVLRQGKNLVATWENLVLAYWEESPTAEPMRAIHEAHLALLHRYPKVGHLVLVRGGALMPSAEGREVATRYSGKSRMSSIAIVLEAEGFWAGAARAFLTTVLFLKSRSGAPTQLFRDADAALEWQGRMLGDAAPNRIATAAALRELRRETQR
ncbi:MAG: hypothetical protein AAF447_06335 [Myxococcota bacterium]